MGNNKKIDFRGVYAKMDEVDKTQERMDLEMEAAMKGVGETVIPEGDGFCYHCDEPVDGTKRWCDASCRDSWEAERKKAPGQRRG